MPHTTALIATLVVYQVVLLGIGFWATRRSRSSSDYYLGGRGLGAWVAALSASASSSSAWTLLAVSGAAFTHGVSALWILPACLGGFLLNWFVVAPRLRRDSLRTGAITLTEFLAAGHPHRAARRIVVVASVIVLLSLGTYVASQFQAAGKTFAEILEVSPTTAVLIGGGVVVLYTFSGGFWAASVTDTLQGGVMVLACLLVPGVALLAVGGPGGLADGLAAAGDGFADWTRGRSGFALLGLIAGTLGIGLGYPGQPHVVNRFMALRSEAELRRGAVISILWAVIVYSGMLLAGLCGRVLFGTLGDDETVLLRLATDLLPPALAGVVVAAILSAIMSTADSQLLVCGSTVSHDLPERPPQRRALLDRAAVLGISVLAILAAVYVEETIFDTVLFAWSGLGAAFGPLLLVRLVLGPVPAGWTLAAMLVGFGVTLVWFFSEPWFGYDLKAVVYELVPAFLAALVVAGLGALVARRPRLGPPR